MVPYHGMVGTIWWWYCLVGEVVFAVRAKTDYDKVGVFMRLVAA